MNKLFPLLILVLLVSFAACDSSGGGGEAGDTVATVDGFTFADSAVGEDVPVADVCTPQCGPLEEGGEPRECGDDGCGGVCGECEAGTICNGAMCEPCEPQCDPVEDGGLPANCGDDGCGGVCGECGTYQECNYQTRRCEMSCIPNCAGKVCGPDGCGSSCGDCPTGEVCNRAKGSCAATCEPWCPDHRNCGGDGCGGSCANQDGCQFPETCDEATGYCVDECIRDCEGKECGEDGCGGRCAYCPTGEGCQNGTCVPLELTCAQVKACVDVCPATDENCPSDCTVEAASSSISLYQSFESCRESSCGNRADADMDACLLESCANQYTACGLDFRCGDPGQKQCSTVSGCMSSCGDAACVNACLCQANESSYSAALAYAQCLVQSCPDMESSCVSAAGGMMMGACMQQWLNCFGQ